MTTGQDHGQEQADYQDPEHKQLRCVPAQRVVSQLDAAGYFVAPVDADESPLEPGVWLIPGGAIDRLPPVAQKAGKLYRPNDADGWEELDDFRHTPMYRTQDGSPYFAGVQTDQGTYEGIGPMPAWLTLLAKPNRWSVWDGQGWVPDADLFAATRLQENTALKARKLDEAGRIIAILIDAQNLGIATQAELDALAAWKTYRVLVSRVDPAELEPQWPDAPTS